MTVKNSAADEPINVNDSPEEISRKMQAAYVENARIRSEVPNLHAEARQAIENYKGQHKSLYAGKFPKFPEAEHDERLNHYRSERNKALRAVQERARELYQETQKEADRAGEVSATNVLSTSARQQANELLPLVETEVAGLGGAPLQRRLQHVAENGDQAEQYAYLLAARKRAAEQVRRENSSGGVPQSGVPSALAAVLGDLEHRVSGEAREKARAAYDGKLGMLDDVLGMCYLGLNDVNSAHGIQAKRYAVPQNNTNVSHSGGRIARTR